jgi:hypothetical protein
METSEYIDRSNLLFDQQILGEYVIEYSIDSPYHSCLIDLLYNFMVH